MEGFDQVFSVDMGQGFPAVMCFGETLPSDQVLKLIAPTSRPQNLLHFPFWLSVDKVRGWFREVGPVFPGFLVGGEKRGMESWVDLP